MKFLKKRLIQENHKDKYIWVHPKEVGESRRGKGEGKKFHIKPPESVFTQNQVKTRGAQKSSISQIKLQRTAQVWAKTL